VASNLKLMVSNIQLNSKRRSVLKQLQSD